MKGTIIFDLEGTLVAYGKTSILTILITVDLLAKLSKEYELAIVTGATREQLEDVLQSSFLGLYFENELTITKNEVFDAKATGKPFQALLDKDISRPTVVIGDSEGDRIGSAAVGVPFVLVNTAKLLSHDVSMEAYVENAVKQLEMIA